MDTKVAVGEVVVTAQGYAGLVRFVYPSPAGEMAVVRLDSAHVAVLPVNTLSALPEQMMLPEDMGTASG